MWVLLWELLWALMWELLWELLWELTLVLLLALMLKPPPWAARRLSSRRRLLAKTFLDLPNPAANSPNSRISRRSP